MTTLNKNSIDVRSLEGILTFDELAKHGVKPGDIVARPAGQYENGVAWNYHLLCKDFPDYFDVSICCHKDPRTPHQMMHLYQIGFHWCGSKDSLLFRIATPGEKEDFINSCIETLKNPLDECTWDIDHRSQILHNMVRDGLISKSLGQKLNRELKEIHGTDLLKYYKKHYN